VPRYFLTGIIAVGHDASSLRSACFPSSISQGGPRLFEESASNGYTAIDDGSTREPHGPVRTLFGGRTLNNLFRRATLNYLCTSPQDELSQAVDQWESSHRGKGEVFTKSEIVDFMIDISGLDDADSTGSLRILEPSCGHGAFLIPVINRLLGKLSKNRKLSEVEALADKILAFDIVEKNADETRRQVKNTLAAFDFSDDEANYLADKWVIHGDFLQANVVGGFTHVIGNPPYVRVESIPKILLDAYRSMFETMGDRSDLYIAFFEKSLSLLKGDGKLCFICTDRWTKNQYGRKLRKLISEKYSFDLFVDLYGSDAFKTKVLTYPAITLISNRKLAHTLLCHNPIVSKELSYAIHESLSSNAVHDCPQLHFRKDVVNGEHPWLLGSADQIELVRKLEENFPPLEEANCRVYIGAATGNNKVFIVDKAVAVEKSRKLPVISASEIRGGEIKYQGKFIINTYDENGVVDLGKYPLLAAHLKHSEKELRKRHVAQNSPLAWYKTIDRVYPERAGRPKLMIPDIKSELTVVYENGEYHPNNSIYYICSNEWNLHALKCILISGIGNLFIQTYTTKIANGFMRFQAQHLRRIRVPLWSSISLKMKSALIDAGINEDRPRCTELAEKLYNLTSQEKELIGDF